MNKNPFINERFKIYLFRYRFEGTEWAVEIPARSPSEAKQRLSYLTFAQYDGELVAKIPASLGLIARITAAIRNAIFGCK